METGHGTSALRATIAGIAVLVLTIAHHAYGAALYQTPWRNHVAHVAGWQIALLLALYAGYRFTGAGTARRVLLALLLVGLLLGPVAWIGLFEGGYNHVLKIVLYAVGASQGLLDRLFPPPVYEPPTDLWFEASGVLQLLVALLCVHWLRAAWRAERAGTATAPRAA